MTTARPQARSWRSSSPATDDRAGHLDRHHRPARDPPRPRILTGRAVVGPERLPARLRRAAAARRPCRRPARPPPHVRRRLAVFTAAVAVAVGMAQSPGLVDRRARGYRAPARQSSRHRRSRCSRPASPQGPERTRAVSYYAAVAGVGATLGLVLGGMFAGWLSWRVGFFINVPIGIALMLAAPRVLPGDRTSLRAGSTSPARSAPRSA